MDEAVRRIADSWEYVLPEILLVVTACVYFLAGPFLVNERGEAPEGMRHRWGGLTLFALIAAGVLWWRMSPVEDAALWGLFRADAMTWFIRGLALASGGILLLTTWNQISDAVSAEHHACLLLATAGTSLVVAANDLVALFLALELVSIATYIVLYLGRHDAAGQEAVVKYFLLSVFSSAIFLFGLSYLYGLTGTTSLTAMHVALSPAEASSHSAALLVAIGAVITGLGFRITIFPFHYYAPDVFQGTAVGEAAFLSFIPKIVGFVALVRVLTSPIGLDAADTLVAHAEPVLWGLAILSMTVGNVLALLQNDVRRIMAYSSVAHAGYMLSALAIIPHHDAKVAGVPVLLFYLAVYGAMTLGVFAVLAAVEGRITSPGSDLHKTTDGIAGLGRTHPLAAVFMAIFLFSLTGLPPTAGFFAKFNLLLAVWSAGTTIAHWTAALIVINAAIAGWYYLRLVAVMYVAGTPERPRDRAAWPALAGAALCAVVTIGGFLAPNWLWQAASRIGG